MLVPNGVHGNANIPSIARLTIVGPRFASQTFPGG
jgi:hypothetical protein